MYLFGSTEPSGFHTGVNVPIIRCYTDAGVISPRNLEFLEFHCFPGHHWVVRNCSCTHAFFTSYVFFSAQFEFLFYVHSFCTSNQFLDNFYSDAGKNHAFLVQISPIAKIIISQLPGLSEKSSAVIGQFVITTAVRGVPKPQQTACLFWFGYPPSRELKRN